MMPIDDDRWQKQVAHDLRVGLEQAWERFIIGDSIAQHDNWLRAIGYLIQVEFEPDGPPPEFFDLPPQEPASGYHDVQKRPFPQPRAAWHP